MSTPYRTGEFTLPSEELGIMANNPTIDSLGLLATTFTVHYEHTGPYSQYDVSFDMPDLSPDQTHELLYAPYGLRNNRWTPDATYKQLSRLLDSTNEIYRRGQDTYGPMSGNRLNFNAQLNDVMDVLDSTDKLAWTSSSDIAVYDSSSIEAELFKIENNISVVALSSLLAEVGTEDRPRFHHKYIGRLPRRQQRTKIQEYLLDLPDESREELHKIIQARYFVSPPTEDESETIYIPKKRLPTNLQPANIVEAEIGDLVVYDKRDPRANIPIRTVRFRTTETLSVARPLISWLTPTNNNRYLLWPESDSDLTLDGNEVTEHKISSLVGGFVLASQLSDTTFVDALRGTVPPQRVAMTAYALGVEKGDKGSAAILGASHIVGSIEALVRARPS